MERKYLFDEVAKEYNQIRPSYPKELFEDIILYSQISQKSELLEIGCGTGQATQGFIDLDYKNITCVELGKNLALLTREKFKHLNTIKVHQSSFEEWDSNERFDLVYSATAFHFIDPHVGLPKVYHHLKSNGTIALFWTVHVPIYDNLHNEIRELYKKYAPQLDDSTKPTPEQVINDKQMTLESSKLFNTIEVHTYQYDETYSSKNYISLLNTHSKHRQLEEQTKHHLFHEIEQIINRHGGFIDKPQLFALFLGKKD